MKIIEVISCERLYTFVFFCTLQILYFFSAFHAYLNDRVDTYLQDHNPDQCLVCVGNNRDVCTSDESKLKINGKYATNQNGLAVDSHTPTEYVTDAFGKIFSDIFG